MSKSKQKGTAAETAVVKWLQTFRGKSVERRTLNGVKDRGDIAGLPEVVIEVKDHARMELAQWVREMEAEMVNDEAKHGVVIHKKRGTTDVGEWYATTTVSHWHDLLTEAGY